MRNNCYSRANCRKNRLAGPFWLLLLSAALSIATPAAAAETISMDNVEAAILAADVREGSLKEKWAPVVKLLEAIHVATPDPVLRLIKGHACLAVNENNESLCLFFSIMSKSELQQWEAWSQHFAGRYDDKAIAWYYRADAAARLSRWHEAVSFFARALDLHKEHPLVLNGRGVAYAHQNNLDEARADFDKAVRYSGSSLADAHANIGALRIQTQDGAKGALTAFSLALDASKQFALALHGRGCVELIKGSEEGKQHLSEALRLVECGRPIDLMLRNGIRYAAAVSGADPELLLADAREAGTSLRRGYYEQQSAKAESALKTAETLRGWAWLPFNQRAADLVANRHVEAVQAIDRRLGAAGTDRFYNEHPELQSPSLREIVTRVGPYNGPELQSAQQKARGVGQTMDVLGTGAVLASLGGVITAKAAIPSGVAALAGKGTAAVATNMLDWSREHSAFAQSMASRYGSPSAANPNATRDQLIVDQVLKQYRPGGGGPPPPPGGAGTLLGARAMGGGGGGGPPPPPGGAGPGSGSQTADKPGGVQISLADIKWDDGKWPFKPYYGLAYALVELQDRPVPSQQPEKVPTHAKPK